jgi:hypothetical protein
MELPRLAAKQKRLIDLSRYTNEEALDPAVRSKLLLVLDSYRKALAVAWRTPEQPGDLDSIERELETLFNDARLRTTRP